MCVFVCVCVLSTMYQTQWEVEGQLLCMRFVSVIMFIMNIVKIYGDFVIFTAVFIVLFVSNFCRPKFY